MFILGTDSSARWICPARPTPCVAVAVADKNGTVEILTEIGVVAIKSESGESELLLYSCSWTRWGKCKVFPFSSSKASFNCDSNTCIFSCAVREEILVDLNCSLQYCSSFNKSWIFCVTSTIMRQRTILVSLALFRVGWVVTYLKCRRSYSHKRGGSFDSVSTSWLQYLKEAINNSFGVYDLHIHGLIDLQSSFHVNHGHHSLFFPVSTHHIIPSTSRESLLSEHTDNVMYQTRLLQWLDK